MPHTITRILEAATQEFLKEDCRSGHVYEINTGWCGDYADYVGQQLAGEPETASAKAAKMASGILTYPYYSI